MIKVAPSILAADALNMERDIARAVESGCDWLHFDVMDGHFVPNLSFGPDLCKAVHRRFPELPLDVHLMLDNPEKYLATFAKAGAARITIHVEIPGDVGEALRTIHSLGCKAGLSVKPGTPAEALAPYLDACDLALVMTVEPGFGGQSFMAEQMEKLNTLRRMGFKGLLQVDGGVNASNLPALAAHGLDVAVMGTAFFRAEDPAALVREAHGL